MGNRRYQAVSPHTRSVYIPHDCQDFTADWQSWEGGLSGNIRVKKDQPKEQNDVEEVKESRAIASSQWEVELVFDNPFNRIDVYNGVSDTIQGNRVRVTSPSWASRSQTDSTFSLRASFPTTSAMPRLKGITMNGAYHECKPPQRATSQAITKGIRIGTSTHVAWPSKVLGLYILLADDDEEGFESEASDWEPQLFPWQQEASNVLFFTFIHPDTMDIPPSFQKLAATRGTGAPGAVPANTVIMFAIGGYAYSLKPNPWHWLTSKEAAEKMAVKVAEWPDKYGCDGIDLDLEEGAGAKKAAGPNMIHFIRKLKELWPNVIVSQPTYGYPQVQAEIDVINASWDTEGNHQGLADSIGLMVYEGTNALNYVKNYAAGSKQWQGFPIKVDAPSNTILLGAKGATSYSAISKMANAVVKDDLLGIMVWYASVKNGFKYSVTWDASDKDEAIRGYKDAMKLFNKHMAG